MTSLTRRFGLIVIAALCGGTVLTLAPGTAAAAGLGTATPNPSVIANTATAQVVSITNSVPTVLPAAAQLVGPGSQTDTYAGTGTSTDGSSTTFNLDPTGLPAAPGVYTLNVCPLSCGVAFDSGSITVVGAPPVPHQPATAFTAAPGGSVAGFALAGTGFAKDESISIARSGGAASDVTFTENNASSTATHLAGTFEVGGSVPPGIYDLVITDTAGQKGNCGSCLEVTGSSSGPMPVTDLSVAAINATTASARWNAPTSGPAPTTYHVTVASDDSSAAHGTVTVSGTSATITGLSPATLYYVTVKASDGTNDSLPNTKPLQMPYPTVLSLGASRSSVVAGGSVRLSGLLVHTVGNKPPTPLAGQSIVIAAKSDTKKVSKVGTAQTKNNGTYSFTVFPKFNATYVAIFNGDNGGASGIPDAPAVSNGFPRVTVAPNVVAAPKNNKVHKGGKLVVLGFVSPKEAGRHVTLVRIDGTGKAHRAGRATLTASSHFVIHGKLPKIRGTYSYQVRITARTGNLAGHSAIFHVRRVR